MIKKHFVISILLIIQILILLIQLFQITGITISQHIKSLNYG